MTEPVSAQSLANIMSLSVAPVFLISSVAVLVSCMATRYGRVIDRTRTLLRDGDKLYGKFRSSNHLGSEIRGQYLRARKLRTAIILAAGSIFFVVLAICLVYVDLSFDLHFTGAAVISFLISLVILLLSLGIFIGDFMTSLTSLKNDINTRNQDVDLGEQPRSEM